MIRFDIYIRHGCHLCEDLLEQVQQLQGRHGFEIQAINVDSSPELVGQFGTRVPVVMFGDREICHYFLDPAALVQTINTNSPLDR